MAFGRGDRARTLRKDRSGFNPVVVGLVAGVIAVIGVYLGFTKSNPFAHPFKVNAVFESANSIRANSPVRIAGVNVGKVTSIKRQPGTDAAIVQMSIMNKGLPIHKDATLKIRPRIFLEGNFFVDVSPGTPEAPTLGDGDTIPMTQTATPVQLDQVLTALQGGTREDLQTILQQYGTALTFKPSVADDQDAAPDARGESAAKSLNDTAKTSPEALKDTAIVNDALQGTETHDLSGLIQGLGSVTHTLDMRESSLQDFVTNFNTTMGALAAEKVSLRATIHQLGPTLRTTSRTLTSLNDSFPATRAFAREILPGVRETPATIAAAFPWIRQTRALLGPSELRGLVKQLSPTTASLSRVTNTTRQLLPQIDLAAQCATKVILPTGDIKIQDGNLTTGVENYKEFWYAMVGLAGEGQNFDGNGQYVRFQTGGGDQSVSSGNIGGSTGEKLFANAASAPLGTRPAYPGHRPPDNPNVPCKDDPIPDVNGAKTGSADGGGGTPIGGGGGATGVTGIVSGVTGVVGSLLPPTASARATKDDSLTGELVSHLNPFRKAGR